MFKIGDKAVYPPHGVGEIESIQVREISGKKQSFYILRILENDMLVMVPTDNTEADGMRGLISRRDVPNVYKILKQRNIKIDNQPWNRRYREYMEKINTGDLFEIAGVLRDLFLLKNSKELSFGERNLLDEAKMRLIKEISLARRSKEETVEAELAKIFEV